MNLSRPLLKVIYEHLCMLSLKKDCHFFYVCQVQSFKLLQFVGNEYGAVCVRALLSTLCLNFGLGLKKNFKLLELSAF